MHAGGLAAAPHRASALVNAAPEDLEQTVALCLCRLQTEPVTWDVVQRLGLSLRRLGRAADALPFLEAGLAAKPDDPDCLVELADVLIDLQRLPEARNLIGCALSVAPTSADAHHTHGRILLALGERNAAAHAFETAVSLDAALTPAWIALGQSHYHLGQHAEALAAFERALAQAPHRVELWSAHGDILYERQTYAEALVSYRRALALDPHLAVVHVQCGNILYFDSRFEEALTAYDTAVALAPDLPSARLNRANTLKELARFAEALSDLDHVLAMTPEDGVARFNRAHLLLLLGRLEEGLEDYEERKRVQNRSARQFTTPEWTSSKSSASLLVHTEQGLGDTIQFARFAKRVAQRGVDVTLEVQPSIARLMRTLEGVRVVARGDALPAFTDHIQIMSLPRALGIGFAELGEPPYLAAEPKRVAAWRSQISTTRFTVGIAWQGSPHPLTDRGRSFPLKAFAPLAAHPDVQLVSLQKNEGSDQLADCGFAEHILSLGPEFDAGADAFIDTAAVMSQLDLIVTSDTSIAHLAGALGRPVWIVLQHVPNWRWFLGRQDCPWYPTARLFRQPARGDWAGAFQAVNAALREVLAARQRHPEGNKR